MDKTYQWHHSNFGKYVNDGQASFDIFPKEKYTIPGHFTHERYIREA